jgi:hypothetical protein
VSGSYLCLAPESKSGYNAALSRQLYIYSLKDGEHGQGRKESSSAYQDPAQEFESFLGAKMMNTRIFSPIVLSMVRDSLHSSITSPLSDIV